MSTAAPASRRRLKPRRTAAAVETHEAFRLAAQLNEEKAELRKELEFQITLLHALARKCEERIARLK